MLFCQAHPVEEKNVIGTVIGFGLPSAVKFADINSSNTSSGSVCRPVVKKKVLPVSQPSVDTIDRTTEDAEEKDNNKKRKAESSVAEFAE